MAAKKTIEEETFTVVTPEAAPAYTGPMVDVFIPALEDGGPGGMKVDQYEHVTIANEKSETPYKVLRGEHVSVPVPVFVALKARYPKI